MLISLQALRALAAWLVVFHHVMQIFFDFKADSAFGRFFVERGAIGVDIFFVISGFVIYLSTRGKDIQAGRFMLNRFLRIVPAYWLYSVMVALIIVYARPVMPTQSFDLHHFLLSLLFVPSENPAGYGLYPTLAVGWTLNYEMFFYLLFALSLIAPQRWRPGLIGVALVLVSTVLARQPWLSDFYRNSIVYEFLFGVAIGVAHSRGWLRLDVGLALTLLATSLLAICQLDSSMRLFHWGVPSAMLVVACIALEPMFRNARPLKVLGDCSYSVYLVHVIVLSVGWYLLDRYALNTYLVIAACLPVILLASWASYEWIEKRSFAYARRWLDTDPQRLPRPQLS